MIANCKKLTALVAVLLSLFMLMSLCAVTVSATEAATTAETTVETTAETTAETSKETSKETAKETATETAKETTKVTTAETTATATDNTKTIRGLVNLGVGAVILIVLAILAIKFRAKIPGWWKALKSECGKISWCSKDKLKKNTLVVVIVIVAIVIAIAVLDFVFSQAVEMLISLF